MRWLKSGILLFGALFITVQIQCQITYSQDSLPPSNKFQAKKFIIPSALIITGILGLESHTFKDVNSQIQNEVYEHIDEQLTVDDFSQYAPGLAVYVLNAAGIEGKHRFGERSLLLATSYLLTAGTTLILKNTAHQLRPDGSSYNSFPSGHTATAFVGAEFLWQEYKDKSVWYGILGYSVAAGTGIFRMYNDRHWLNDVLMGAGIGMFCTKLTYWLHPFVTKKLFHKKKAQALVVPFYNGEQFGLGAVFRL